MKQQSSVRKTVGDGDQWRTWTREIKAQVMSWNASDGPLCEWFNDSVWQNSDVNQIRKILNKI